MTKQNDISNTNLSSGLSGGRRVAFLRALWHDDMTGNARDGFTEALSEQGFGDNRIDCYDVPGAFELPLTAKRLAESGDYAVIVAGGFVVDGGIYRHDFVSAAVIDGLMRVQLDTGVPVLSVVLTPHNFQESEDHISFFRAHMKGKGREAASACLAMLALGEKLAA